MSRVSSLKISAILFNLLTICTYGDPGNLRTMEMQNFPVENERQMASLPNTIYYPNMYSMPYEQSRLVEEKSVPTMEPPSSKSSVTYNDFVDALNELTDYHDGYRNDGYRNDGYRKVGYRNNGYRNDGYHNVEMQSRAATKFADPISINKPLKYSFEKPHNVPWSPNIYQDSPAVLSPAISPTPLWKPRFGLLESGLAAPSKWGSLLKLGFALMGGSDIKDVLVNNILKPLLVSKSGLKAIISKLAIPVVALVLVNVEILVVVWWLWEECPEVPPIETTIPYSQTTFSNFSAAKRDNPSLE